MYDNRNSDIVAKYLLALPDTEYPARAKRTTRTAPSPQIQAYASDDGILTWHGLFIRPKHEWRHRRPHAPNRLRTTKDNGNLYVQDRFDAAVLAAVPPAENSLPM